MPSFNFSYSSFFLTISSLINSSSVPPSSSTPSIFYKASLIFVFFAFDRFSSFIFLYIQLKRFLTLFSVLPGRIFIISDHLFPISDLLYNIKRSSSIVKGSLLISGFKKLYHLSLHCLPFLLLFRLLFN